MATKMITRTLKVYTYTTGSINFNNMKVENMRNHSFPYKLGARAKRELEHTAGAAIIRESEGSALYGMSLDEFMKHAKALTDAEAAELAVMDEE